MGSNPIVSATTLGFCFIIGSLGDFWICASHKNRPIYSGMGAAFMGPAPRLSEKDACHHVLSLPQTKPQATLSNERPQRIQRNRCIPFMLKNLKRKAYNTKNFVSVGPNLRIRSGFGTKRTYTCRSTKWKILGQFEFESIRLR